jgi:hypothetical protein
MQCARVIPRTLRQVQDEEASMPDGSELQTSEDTVYRNNNQRYSYSVHFRRPNCFTVSPRSFKWWFCIARKMLRVHPPAQDRMYMLEGMKVEENTMHDLYRQ